jgi:hypothetical protein
MRIILTSFNRRFDNAIIEAVIIPELTLSDIEAKVLFTEIVEGPDDATLEDAPEAFNRIGVDHAHNNVLMPRIVHGDVREGPF